VTNIGTGSATISVLLATGMGFQLSATWLGTISAVVVGFYGEGMPMLRWRIEMNTLSRGCSAMETAHSRPGDLRVGNSPGIGGSRLNAMHLIWLQQGSGQHLSVLARQWSEHQAQATYALEFPRGIGGGRPKRRWQS